MGNSSNSSQLQDGWDPNTCFLVQREVTSHRSPTPSYHLHTQPLSTPRSTREVLESPVGGSLSTAGPKGDW